MKLLSYRGVSELLADESEATIRRRIKAGELPAPIVLSTRRDGLPARVGFVATEVEAAIERLVDRRRGLSSAELLNRSGSAA